MYIYMLKCIYIYMAISQWGSNMTFTENVRDSKTLDIYITLKFTLYRVRKFLVFVNITNRTRDLVF